MELNEILTIALRGGASDIHLKAGLPPMFRVDGSLGPLTVRGGVHDKSVAFGQPFCWRVRGVVRVDCVVGRRQCGLSSELQLR